MTWKHTSKKQRYLEINMRTFFRSITMITVTFAWKRCIKKTPKVSMSCVCHDLDLFQFDSFVSVCIALFILHTLHDWKVCRTDSVKIAKIVFERNFKIIKIKNKKIGINLLLQRETSAWISLIYSLAVFETQPLQLDFYCCWFHFDIYLLFIYLFIYLMLTMFCLF